MLPDVSLPGSLKFQLRALESSSDRRLFESGNSTGSLRASSTHGHHGDYREKCVDFGVSRLFTRFKR